MSEAALVTGGSGGIGRAICLQLAKDGYDVCVHYNSNRLAAEEVCREIEALGRKAIALGGDLGDSTACAALVQGCVETLGGLCALVNNAGVTCDGLLMRMTDEQYHKVLRSNLDSCFFMTREAINVMAREKRGKIVNITSVVGLTGNAGQVNYAASKAGMVGLTKSAAKEVARWGICVNAVAPGFIETAMTDAMTDIAKDALKKSIPMRRIGKAEDVAAMVSFLCSEGAGYVTGQVFVVDGGMAM
ncbi:MAG: 3-oxoacyl-[acyl-carrier-protein] reductase [Clostridiales bacterium]|nr:3-oxoacyl-[acyl-carrier-protein] reductase [Clostridiales bacterium]